MDETVRSVRSALVDVLAGEHRLRRLAIQERREADRWHGRAAMAQGRGLLELADQARERAAKHEAGAHRLGRRADEIRLQADRLRAALAATHSLERAPPQPRSLESRLAELEIERELDRIRQAKPIGASAPKPDASQSQEV